MNPTDEIKAGEPTDFDQWTRPQKLAALLLILNPENAAQIMKGLDEPDLEAVSREMAKFAVISQELQTKVLQEFSGTAVQAGSAIACGVERVQNLLEKSVGLLRASDLIWRVAPSGAPVTAMQPIVELDARQIFTLLRDEQLQTIALVTSYLTPEKASQLLAMLRPELRERVVERLATLAPTSIKIVENVAEALQQKAGKNRTPALNHTGGLKVAAQLLNAMPRTVSESILISLKERNADLGEAVRQKMFTFDELHRLDPKTLQRILQTVETQTLIFALKSASDKLKNTLLACLSKRAAENVREEIEMMGVVKLRDIEAAQTAIIDSARHLESEGEIDLEELRPNSQRYPSNSIRA